MKRLLVFLLMIVFYVNSTPAIILANPEEYSGENAGLVMEEGDADTDPDGTGVTEESATPEESETPEEPGAPEDAGIIYDRQPESEVDVQEWIELFETTLAQHGFMAAIDVKPRWQYEVPAEFMPFGYHCDLVDWDEDFGAVYYSFFPDPVPITDRPLATFTAAGLQSLIDTAAAGDTITISSGFNFSGVSINISKAVTIRSFNTASPITLNQSANNRRHFVVESGGSLTLQGITLTGSNTGGGVQVNAGGSFTMKTGAVIQNCRIDDTWGGGVYINGGSFTMEDGKISANTQTKSGSGGGGVGLYGGSFRMDGGEISGNKAYIGGGVDIFGGSFIMNGGVISGNIVETANGYGGGVVIYGDGGPGPTSSTMNGGTISGNRADRGGGVFVHFSSFKMNRGTISGNTAKIRGGGVCISNSTFEIYSGADITDNTAQEGGGIYSTNGIALGGGKIAGNKAADGGGVYLAASQTLNISGSAIISGNHAVGDPTPGSTLVGAGGGVFAGKNCTVTIGSGVKISGNDALHLGGGVFVGDRLSLPVSGSVTVNGAEIENNSARLGGGVYADAKNRISVQGGAKITGNTTDGDGGGIFFINGALTVTGTGTLIGNNTSSYNGGGIYAFTGDDCSVTVQDGAVIDRNTGYNGGGICTAHVDSDPHVRVVIDNATLSNNISLGEIFDGFMGGGGAIFSSSSDITVRNGAKITGNTAVDAGGGGIRGVETKIAVTGAGTEISGNRSASGGGIFVDEGSEAVISGGAKIRQNDALTGSGGGIYAKKSDLRIESGAKIVGNTALYYSVGDTGDGGGIYMTEGTGLAVSDSEITDNEAISGGGIANDYGNGAVPCSISLDNTLVSRNKASAGGGGILAFALELTITDSQISENTAVSDGGGILSWYGKLDVFDSVITHNTSGYAGGGISSSDNTVKINDSTVSLNTAKNFGGGVYLSGNAGLEVTGGDITGNTATTFHGGGIYAGGSVTVKIGGVCGIANNKAPAGQGGGIYTAKPGYLNLDIGEDVAFSGNSASKQEPPPENALALWWSFIKTSSCSIAGYSHPANVYDINVFYYTVTFKNGNDTWDTRSVPGGYKVSRPSDPENPGYWFDGWYKDNGTFANKWDFSSDPVMSDITLYASWSDQILKVSIPVKLLWAAFDDEEIASPDYQIINESSFPITVRGILIQPSYYEDEGLTLVDGIPGPDELRLDIVGGDDFAGLSGEPNPFASDMPGICFGDIHVFGVLESAGDGGNVGWFRIGGKYGGPEPVIALKPVYAIEFRFGGT